MNFIKFCHDYNIAYLKDMSHKHAQKGWIQLFDDCPFCTGNAGHHLGYNLTKQYFNCWRCGKHNAVKVIATILKTSNANARNIIEQYKPRPKDRFKFTTDSVSRVEQCWFIGNPKPLLDVHNRYIIKRGFDPEQIKKEWNVLGTGPCQEYGLRIIMPIYQGNDMVSWYSRDITGKSVAKYKPCPKELEKIPHKHMLYGMWKIDNDDSIIVVEGTLDAWRFGKGAVATLGIDFTQQQVLALTKIKRVFIIFDPEPVAQEQAHKLANALTVLGTDAIVIDTETTDPADMTQDDADTIKKQLLFSKNW